MKIYLIRHGQTTGDVEDRYGGDYDDHLTEEGRAQAQKLMEKLKNSGIEVIFCSTLIRAEETAEILAKKIGCKIELVDSVRERNNYGILTGMTKVEAKEKHPEYVEMLKKFDHSMPTSESYGEFSERIKNALDKFTTLPFENIGILTHGGPIRFIFREILKLGEIDIDDCSYVELVYKNDVFAVQKLDGIEILSSRT